MKNILFVVGFVLASINFSWAQKDSLYKNYYKNGKVSSVGRKVNNIMQGEWKYYDDSLGYLKKIINFKDDLYHGVYIEYHVNGKIKIIGYYDRNFIINEVIEGGFTVTRAVKIGSWDYFNINGQLSKTEVHDCTGKIIKTLPQY